MRHWVGSFRHASGWLCCMAWQWLLRLPSPTPPTVCPFQIEEPELEADEEDGEDDRENWAYGEVCCAWGIMLPHGFCWAGEWQGGRPVVPDQAHRDTQPAQQCCSALSVPPGHNMLLRRKKRRRRRRRTLISMRRMRRMRRTCWTSCWPPRRAELEQLGPAPPDCECCEPALACNTACKIAPPGAAF